MVQIGYHASHEQFKPSDLLKWVQMAEQVGFTRVLSSDHFHPWSEQQGQSGFAWSDRDETSAKQKAHQQWRNNIFKNIVMTELRTPQQFDATGKFVKPDELDPYVRISADPQQHIEWLQRDIELGFNELVLHNVNPEQEQFIKDFGEEVLPALTDR